MTLPFEGRSALVTGGGSGIGLATASRFAELGAIVTICGRTTEKLEAAAAAIEAEVPRAVVRTISADVTVEEDVAAAVDVAAAITGRLDVLFACAGGSMHMGAIVDADDAAVRGTVELNLIGSFLCVKHAARMMIPAGGGSIVLMSSGAGHFPHRWLWAYGMAKRGIESLCDSAAEELAESKIRVNVVQPGIIDDELMSFITAGGALFDDYMAETPLGRAGTVEDVAKAVTFLAGDDAAWITGEHLSVDGGHHLRRGADYSKLFS